MPLVGEEGDGQDHESQREHANAHVVARDLSVDVVSLTESLDLSALEVADHEEHLAVLVIERRDARRVLDVVELGEAQSRIVARQGRDFSREVVLGARVACPLRRA